MPTSPSRNSGVPTEAAVRVPARPVREAEDGFRIFKGEERTVELAQELLDATPEDGMVERAAFADLLRAYEKLFKGSRRLVRLADRNEAILNELTRSLNDRNATLERLSAQLAKYLPAQLYRAIFAGEQQGELATRRKKLTVFFSDIKDFTAITEDLQPEDLTWILNDYFTEMTRIAADYGATINKFVGDAMSMFFGDADSRGVEADAKACVRMAAAMQQRMVVLRERWRRRGFEKPFHMRIGISTGYCNVGNFGSPDRMDYTIIGSPVNLAARLESAADPDGILIAYETHAVVGDVVRAEAQAPLTVKGIPRPVQAYAVQAVLDDRSGTERYLRQELDGALLSVDFDRLTDTGREQVVEAARALLERLRPEG